MFRRSNDESALPDSAWSGLASVGAAQTRAGARRLIEEGNVLTIRTAAVCPDVAVCADR